MAVRATDPGEPIVEQQDVLAPDGSWMIVEPQAGDRVEDNLNPRGRAYYAASTLVCTPTSLSQEVGLAPGGQAGEAAIRRLVEEAGSTAFRRVSENSFNLVFEVRIRAVKRG